MKSIWKNITWKKILFFAVIFIVFYILINGYPYGVEALKEITGGVSILDLEITYTPEYAYELLNNLGQEGRNFYLYRIIPIDFIFPLTYMMFFSVLITFINQKWLTKTYILQKIKWIPIFTAIFDYSENVLIIIMLINYPQEYYRVAFLAGIMTFIKNTFFVCSIIVPIIGIAGILYKKIRKRSKSYRV